MEAFILDGPMWGSAMGNWLIPNQQRFPNGLAPLVDYAHKKGLLFGLYVEPEGGREGSTSPENGATIGYWSECTTFVQHPEWFLQPQARLNLAIPVAASYFASNLTLIVNQYKLDMYRHDYNAPLHGENTETMRSGFLRE